MPISARTLNAHGFLVGLSSFTNDGSTVIRYARFMPPQPEDSPFILPSDQFRRENRTPPDAQAIATSTTKTPLTAYTQPL